MATFSAAIDVVLEHEGGYVNHPNDPGGETNFGITKRGYPHLDIASLTREEAASIYEADYWNQSYADLESQEIATKVFDTGVNIGTRRAEKMLQRAVNECLGYEELKVDGYVGPKTVSAVNDLGDHEVLAVFRVMQVTRYYKLCKANSNLRPFLMGWIKRALT